MNPFSAKIFRLRHVVASQIMGLMADFYNVSMHDTSLPTSETIDNIKVICFRVF